MSTETRDLRTIVQRRLLEQPFDPRRLTSSELRERLDAFVQTEAPLLPAACAAALLDELVDDVGGLGPLQPFVADPAVTEVLVNGPHSVYIERRGQLEPVACEIDAPTILRVVERIIAPLGLRLDRASPMVDARLADGARLFAVIPPLAPDGPCIAIRRFGVTTLALDDFGAGPGG
ncbi:MAG TPA: ATPase, T2SS/T4P/T4SS family, partial [Acidimicrobiia bacterium]|nr:ATPase, T2SS/T4P/T4SS family [Acidimicrobiia bacterium]